MPSQATTQSKSLPQMMRQHPLFFYFLMAYAFSWIWIVVFILLLHLPLIFAAVSPFVGPTLSAYIMTALTEGKAGMLRLLRRYILWRVPLRWYLVVLIGIPVLLLLSDFAIPGAIAVFPAPTAAFVLTSLVSYIVTFILGGPLGEEPGWRGFALPRLQQCSGPLKGTLVLGVLWGCWHLPLYLIPGYNGAGTGFVGISIPFVEFVIGTVGIAVIFTWVFNNTRGSLLLAMLLHTSLDTDVYSKFFPSLPATQLAIVMPYVFFVGAALLIIVGTRGRLSYEHYLHEMGLPTPKAVAEQEPQPPGMQR